MKILHLSNYYYIRGGDCTYLFSLKKLLEKGGHQNIVFSMHHPRNLDSAYSGYFVSYIDYADEARNKTLLSGLRILSRAVYSMEAKKKIQCLVEKERPDIAHVQSLHHNLTHSVLYPLKQQGIPVVWTLHDYALICPNTHFLCRGYICEKCKRRKFYWSVIRKCKKDSLGASTVAMIETVVHRIMKIRDLVDVFITPSEFLRKKLMEYGFDRERIVCVNNFIDLDPGGEKTESGDYYLYVGRLTREKGVGTLIDAAVKAGAGRLRIVGDGELKDELMSYARGKKGGADIEFCGPVSRDDVMALIKKCRFVVLPSEWYENFPYAVLESFACGKTVIGARIGGIPELVRDNETGLTFEPGNSDDLSSKIRYLNDNPDKRLRMGENARSFVEQKLNAETHYLKIMGIYNAVIKHNKLRISETGKT